MKLLFLSLFILSSCNPLKSLSDGETSLDDNFFEGGNVTSLNNDIIAFYNFHSFNSGYESEFSGMYLNQFGTVTGSVIDEGGRLGNAIDCNQINSTNYVQTSDLSPRLNTNNDFSLSVWIYRKSQAGATAVVTSIQSGADFDITQDPSTDDLRISVGSATDHILGGFFNGSMKHLVVRVSRTNGISTCVNAVCSGFDGQNTTGDNYNTNHLFSPCIKTTEATWDVSIDSLGLWSKVLSQEEVNGLYYGNNDLD